MFDKTNQSDASLNTEPENGYGEILDDVLEDKKEELDVDFDESYTDGDDELYGVIYNGKEMKLSLDELKTNAQKGLNYDHVKNEYDILRAQPGARELLKDARESGLSSKAYLSQQKMRDRRARVEDLMQRGIGEKEAMYVTQIEDRLESIRLEDEKKKPFYDFAAAYPDVKAEDIPDEVWHRFHEGMDLIASYALYENASLKQSLDANAQNVSASNRSTGSVQESVAASAPDAFLEGLLG